MPTVRSHEKNGENILSTSPGEWGKTGTPNRDLPTGTEDWSRARARPGRIASPYQSISERHVRFQTPREIRAAGFTRRRRTGGILSRWGSQFKDPKCEKAPSKESGPRLLLFLAVFCVA